MTNKELQKIVEELLCRVKELENQKVGFDKELYTVGEVAKMLGKSHEGVYKMIRRGELPSIKLGCTRIRAVDIAKIIGKVA